MIIYEDDCCDCAVPAYPCLGNSCPRKFVPHYYCDECQAEDELYEYDDLQLCANCLLSKHKIVVADDIN